ncbi:TIR domain-containing protein [Streptomyces sp. NPDC001985]|uniref:TIR domain-containing protein n=1 Tax=Streptomyces sp. NPDC001985 TaxID=3154406 RepID=UPI0033248F1A
MTNEQPVGFWSYTHRDNDLDRGRIVRLSGQIASSFEIITGEPLEIFLDKNSLDWGEAWRMRLDSALTSTTFLIPIVTPKFLMSQECRREVITFAGHAASLGLDELLLPIHYVNVPQLTQRAEECPADEVVELIAKRQWVDWRDLRLEDEDSPAYRKAVHKLAQWLAKILDATPPATPVAIPPTNQDNEEPPGFLEIMTEMEAALPAWFETVQQFAETISRIGEESTWASDEIATSDKRGGGFTGRMHVTEELASRLTEPVEKVDTLGAKYWAELAAIDPGVIGIIRQASEGNLSTEDRKVTRAFFKEVKGLADTTAVTTSQLQIFSDSMAGAAQGSRRLRPQFKIIQAAVQKVIDSQTIISEWSRMINDVDLGDDDQQ